MLKSSDNMLPPLGCLMRTIPIAYCCCKDRLDDASDIDVDPGIREGAIEEKLTLSVERGTVVYEGDNCVSSFAEHHSGKPSESTHVVSSAMGWSVNPARVSGR